MARGRKKKDEAAPVASIEVEKPDFERAISVLASSITPSEEEGASIRGDLSAAWKVIEKDCHVNKAAAKQYHSLARMSPEKRDDYLRSLYGLMQAGGIGISQDLVDQMGGEAAPEMPVAASKAPELATLQ